MARLLTAALVLACLCLTGGAARAQDDDDPAGDEFSRKGWYLSAFGFYSLEAYRDIRPATFDNSGGFNVRLGYREREWLAFEAEIEWTAFDGQTLVGGSKTSIDANVVTGGINAKLFPMGGRYQPYALIGANGMGVITDRGSGAPEFGGTDWAFRFGTGVDIYTTPNVVVALEGTYVWGLGAVWERDYGTLGVGVLYRF